jgi:hypothetical protein
LRNAELQITAGSWAVLVEADPGRICHGKHGDRASWLQ